MYPSVAAGVLAADDPNTRGAGARSEAFPPAEARRRADRIEWRATPAHGSWPNTAEIELSAPAR